LKKLNTGGVHSSGESVGSIVERGLDLFLADGKHSQNTRLSPVQRLCTRDVLQHAVDEVHRVKLFTPHWSSDLFPTRKICEERRQYTRSTFFFDLSSPKQDREINVHGTCFRRTRSVCLQVVQC